ncbi:MAG: hypothetical protein IPJ36_18350 [Simplicispira sp.]|nr:hypothetical protein [Simplicispira sp.]
MRTERTSQMAHGVARALVIILVFALVGTPARSTVEVTSELAGQESGSAILRIALRDTIAPVDSTYFNVIAQTLDKKYKKWWAVVDLDSSGGNIQAARDWRNTSRERTCGFGRPRCKLHERMRVRTRRRTTRIVNQRAIIGIHRPYDPNDTADTAAQQRQKQDDLGKRIVAFLQTMSVPTRLYEDSVFIAPDRMKILTPTEIATYGLDANDPSVDEANEVREAKSLGISRLELGRRKADARRRCGMDRLNDDTPFAELRKAALCEEKYVKGK